VLFFNLGKSNFILKSNQKLIQEFLTSFLINGSKKAPPPKAITKFCFFISSMLIFFSIFLKYSSPLFSNISFMLFFSLISIMLSMSINSSFSLFAKLFRWLIFQHPSFQLIQGFFSIILPILNLIYHKYVLFSEFKYIFLLCNLNTIDNQALEAQ